MHSTCDIWQSDNFFQDLGLGFGLAVEVPRVNNTIPDTWKELTKQQQEDLLNSFSPELEECIEQVMYWLETKKIVLTGKQDDIGHYEYHDFRTGAERKSKLWVTVSVDEETEFQANNNTLWGKKTEKKWWEFWK